MTTIDNIARANAALEVLPHKNVEKGYSLSYDDNIAAESILTEEEALKAIALGVHVIALSAESTVVMPIPSVNLLTRHLETFQDSPTRLSIDPAYGYDHIGENAIEIAEIKAFVQQTELQPQGHTAPEAVASEAPAPEPRAPETAVSEAVALVTEEASPSEKAEMAQHERPRLFVDMDGTLAVFQPVAAEALYEQGYFENLPSNENVVAAVKSIIADQPWLEVNILSSYLGDSPYALEEKNAWLEKHLPEIPAQSRTFLPYGKEKKEFVPQGIRPTDVLLDDYSKNLHSWEPPGMGIKLLNGINGTHGTWQAATVSHDLSPEQLSAKIIQHVNENLQANELYTDKNLKEILSILEKNGMIQEKQWMQELVGNYTALQKEVFSMRHDLAELKAQTSKVRRGFRKTLRNATDTGERDVSRFHSALDTVKENIKSTCSNCAKAVKAKGLSALWGALDFLKVKKTLTSIQSELKGASAFYHQTAEKLGDVRTEIRGAGVQIANIGRKVAGKERQELPAEPKGKGILYRMQNVLLRTENRLAGMSEIAGKGVSKIEKLESRTSPSERKPLREKLVIAKQKADQRQAEKAGGPPAPGKTAEVAV